MSGNYWLESQYNDGQAWNYNFNNSNFWTNNKTNNNYVRPVLAYRVNAFL